MFIAAYTVTDYLYAIAVVVGALIVIKGVLLVAWVIWASYEEGGIFGDRSLERDVRRASKAGGAYWMPNVSLLTQFARERILTAEDVAERIAEGWTLTEQGKLRFIDPPVIA